MNTYLEVAELMNDLIPVIISGLALVLSVIATVVSMYRKKYERQRAIRIQLSETLSSIGSTDLEGAKLYHEKAKADPDYYQSISPILTQQKASLLNQATYLIEQIPDLASTVDYVAVAFASAGAGDLILADKFYSRAVAVADVEYYKVVALRGYAMFLFTQTRYEEGREQFQNAVKVLTKRDDFSRYTNGATYQQWAWHEAQNAGAMKRADLMYESALNEYKGISNEHNRGNALRNLEQSRNMAMSSGNEVD
ncbi:MAG: hypothetical protein ABIK83_13325 [Candidatus Zixiibacteriota bacterium]